jgi:hypothetical protein
VVWLDAPILFATLFIPQLGAESGVSVTYWMLCVLDLGRSSGTMVFARMHDRSVELGVRLHDCRVGILLGWPILTGLGIQVPLLNLLLELRVDVLDSPPFMVSRSHHASWRPHQP